MASKKEQEANARGLALVFFLLVIGAIGGPIALIVYWLKWEVYAAHWRGVGSVIQVTSKTIDVPRLRLISAERARLEAKREALVSEYESKGLRRRDNGRFYEHSYAGKDANASIDPIADQIRALDEELEQKKSELNAALRHWSEARSKRFAARLGAITYVCTIWWITSHYPNLFVFNSSSSNSQTVELLFALSCASVVAWGAIFVITQLRSVAPRQLDADQAID